MMIKNSEKIDNIEKGLDEIKGHLAKSNEIDFDKMSLTQLFSFMTLSQVYKLGSVLTVFVVTIFMSGYQAAEYTHRQEKLKAEMFQAMTEMWQAASAEKGKVGVASKLPMPIILNNAPNVDLDDLNYHKAHRKLAKNIWQQKTENCDEWDFAKNKQGQRVLRSKKSEKEFVVPEDPESAAHDALAAAEPPAVVGSTDGDAAAIPCNDIPCEHHAEAAHRGTLAIVALFAFPIVVLILLWGVLIGFARSKPPISTSENS